MSKHDDLRRQLLALPPFELKALLDEVDPRKKTGPVPPSRIEVHQATRLSS